MTGDGAPYPYALAVREGVELADDTEYQVAFVLNSYTEEVGQKYNARIEKGSLRTFLRDWLAQQKTVSPNGNPWA